MTTMIQTELVVDRELPVAPAPPNASFTMRPADPHARAVIASYLAASLEASLMVEGYRELGGELLEWSEAALPAQSETLPPE